MARTVPVDRASFLASLRERDRRHREEDHAYEAMMYRARDPPTEATLADIIRFTRDERPEKIDPPEVPSDRNTLAALSRIGQRMRWPDPAPLQDAAAILADWDTLHVTTFLHTLIPDYAIWGPSESTGLERLGISVPYHEAPSSAVAAYGRYLEAIKRLRDDASFEQVPESHHYLTRIVQAGLQDLGEA